ncbi:hypothetical protein MHTCC0001_23470 [Flavobacteriaceae bacterium MHTCC 0001]
MKFTTLFIACITMVYSYSQNKLQSSGSFKEGLNTWQYGIWGEGNDEPEGYITFQDSGKDAQGGCAKIEVTKPSISPNKAVLTSLGVRLAEGKKYKLSFWVKSNTKKASIHVMLYSNYQSGSSQPWSSITTRFLPIKGDGAWEKIEMDFTAKAENENTPLDFNAIALSLGFSKYEGTYYVDQVNVEEL